MPGYGNYPTIPIYPGGSQMVINGETLSNGSKSSAVQIIPSVAGGLSSISVEFQFSSAPGAFSLGIQAADTDNDNSYVSIGFGGATPGSVTSGQFSRVDLQLAASFVRVIVTTNGGVNLTAKITRH